MFNQPISRRRFVQSSAAVAALSTAPNLLGANARGVSLKGKLFKTLKIGMVGEDF